MAHATHRLPSAACPAHSSPIWQSSAAHPTLLPNATGRRATSTWLAREALLLRQLRYRTAQYTSAYLHTSHRDHLAAPSYAPPSPQPRGTPSASPSASVPRGRSAAGGAAQQNRDPTRSKNATQSLARAPTSRILWILRLLRLCVLCTHDCSRLASSLAITAKSEELREARVFRGKVRPLRRTDSCLRRRFLPLQVAGCLCLRC